jgi:DNA-binding transcriptional regulator LsrR (DeoR family)
MPWRDHERLLTKISTMYYIEEKSQQEIAESLKLSRSKVCRMLAEAKSAGIVQIVIKPPFSVCNDLEARFERQFNLREAVIINNHEDDNILMLLGQAGADYIKRITTADDIIGISWGQTLFHVVNQLQPFGISGTKVVQLVGGLSKGGQNVQAAELARRLGELFNSNPMLLHCPAVVTSPQVKQGLLEDENIKRVFDLGKSSTIALIGIGSMSIESQLFKHNHLNPEWHSLLTARGAVGDVCMRFYNKDGLPCCEELDELIMSISLENLKNIRTVICVAGGIEKAEAILGALKGGIPNVLITDKKTAEKILELEIEYRKGGRSI